MNHIFLNKIIVFFLVIIPFQLYSQNHTLNKKSNANIGNEEKLINRKVLILDFVNTGNSTNFEYLENSIPDSFLDPLDRTKSFELLPRSAWQKFVKEGKFKKADAYDEESAIEAGKFSGADVVITGSFTALADEMQIFAKAIELSSGRVMVSRSISTALDNSMFNAINKLTNEMSLQMKDKLPPLSQKVITIEREKYIKIGFQDITYGGMVWRTLVIPGLGHAYANEWRGWLYMPIWAGALGTFVYGAIDFAIKEEAYLAATGGLESAYASMNEAMLIRNIGFVSIIGIYAITLTDILIFGKKYEKLARMEQDTGLNFYAFALPFQNKNKNATGEIYVQFAFEKKL